MMAVTADAEGTSTGLARLARLGHEAHEPEEEIITVSVAEVVMGAMLRAGAIEFDAWHSVVHHPPLAPTASEPWALAWRSLHEQAPRDERSELLSLARAAAARRGHLSKTQETMESIESWAEALAENTANRID